MQIINKHTVLIPPKKRLPVIYRPSLFRYTALAQYNALVPFPFRPLPKELLFYNICHVHHIVYVVFI